MLVCKLVDSFRGYVRLFDFFGRLCRVYLGLVFGFRGGLRFMQMPRKVYLGSIQDVFGIGPGLV